MITRIPEGQICQAFDPKIHMSQEKLKGYNTTEQASVSCVSPAYVYIEGIHGKKFLCDYHYYYEGFMTYPGKRVGKDSWKEIQEYMVDERERVKETFAKDVTTTETLGHRCSVLNSSNKDIQCVSDAFVKVNPIAWAPGKINFTVIADWNNFSKDIFYCNFHYRKFYYRNYNSGIVYEDFHKIVDERFRMTQTIAEQALNILCV
jgi:hypothetical protein